MNGMRRGYCDDDSDNGDYSSDDRNPICSTVRLRGRFRLRSRDGWRGRRIRLDEIIRESQDRMRNAEDRMPVLIKSFIARNIIDCIKG